MLKRILGLLPVIGLALIATSDPHAQGCGSNAIVCENNLPGNPDIEWDITGSGDSTLQGFATDISVNKGGVVHFKVSTTATVFQVDIYRLGYYGGLGARKVASISNVAGRNQAACLLNTTTYLVDCGNWIESTSWSMPATAVSGIYLAKLTRPDTGGKSHILFIVRDDQSTSDLLFQTSDTTWQAYNQYGGYSLYFGNPRAAYKVSYNRPITNRSGYATADYVFYAEYPMVRWLEANGYDVSYFTGADADRNGALIRNHKVFMSVGHDEYWSGGQRTNVEAARAAGVHLAFFSGNEIFWKTRWEPSSDGSNTPFRTLVSYKETHANMVIDPADPPTWTGTWRDPRFSPPADGGRPENALSGQFFAVNRGSAAIAVPAAFANLRFWRNTSVAQLAPGQVATLATQTLGYEWDQDADNGARPPGVIDLSSTTVSVPEYFVDWGNAVAPATATHNLTLYRHPGGALVFGAGTVQYSWGLDTDHDTGPDTGPATPDPNMRQATLNLFADMGVQPQTRQPGLVPASPSSDATPPASTITFPTSGASLPASATLTITGTAADAGGGAVGGVEVSADGGTTWHRATGTQNWSFNWRPGSLGNTTLLSRAVDDSGNLEQPASSVVVNVTDAACPCTIWNDSIAPWDVDSGDPQAVEVGVRFQSAIPGLLTGLRFYKASTNTGTHVGHLWTDSGQQLASVTFTNESASGWQQASLATPISISAGVTYVASYHTAVGHYSVDNFYFGRSGVMQYPLQAVANSVEGNGVYLYGAGGFPNQSYQAENYWVDVVLGQDTTPPAVSMTAPSNGANVSGPNVAVSAAASDNVGIASLQFVLDGVNFGPPITTPPYAATWNTLTTGNGSHTLTAVATDPSGNRTTATAVTVTVGNWSVSGTLSPFSSGAGATVTLNGATSATTTADSQGNFTFTGIGNGTYTVTPAKNGFTFTPAGQSVTVSGANVTGVTFTAQVVPTWSLSGAISPSSVGSGTTLTLSGAASGTATADSSGNYSFTGLMNGTYSVTPSRTGFAFSPAARTVTVNGANVTAVNFTALTVPTIDANVSTDRSNAGTTITSPAFSTTAGSELLLAFIAADDNSSGNTVSGVTGAGLTWQLVRRTNAQRGMSEIWRAFAAGSLTNVSVTATLAQSVSASLTVVTFTGTDTSGSFGSGAIGATGSGNALSGAPTASLVTTRANSLVFGVGNDWDNALARTPGSSQTLVHQYLATVGDTFWVQRINGSTAASGTPATINDAAPTGDRYNLTICEVLPPAGPTWTISGAVTPSSSGSGTTLTLSGAGSATTTADASGNFMFSGLANGTYSVTPSKSGLTFSPASQSVTVNGANVTAINFTATAVPTWNISGTISPSSSGSGATLTLSGASTGTTTADSSGNYTFTGLANGTYTVTPSKPGFTFSPASQSVTVNGANVTAINFTATPVPTWSISGAISPSTSGSGATLTLSGAATGTATADSSGNYTFTGVVNGTYTVMPSKTGFTFSPAGQSATINGANVAGVNFTAQAAAAGLAIDVNVSTDKSPASTTLASPTFSTRAGNELLLALIATDYVSGANATVTSMTGAGLTWQLVVRTNAQLGTSEIWRAFAPTPLTAVSATATLSQSAVSALTILSFTGVDTSGTNGSGAIGAIASANAASGAPTSSVTTTRNGSWVLGVGNDYDNPTARTVGPSQTLVHQYLTPTGDTYWVQRQNSPTPVAGTTVTINDTAPTGDRYNLSVCEILPAP